MLEKSAGHRAITVTMRPVRGSMTRMCLSLQVVANNDPVRFQVID